MHNRTFALTLLLATSLSLGAGAQAGSEAAAGSVSAEAPAYRVAFERRDAVPGIIASSAIKLPFVCTTDGTVFVSFLNDTAPVGVGLPAPPPVLPLSRLVSFSTTGKGQTFDLAQVNDLYISSELDHYVGESEVVLLVRAAREYKPKRKTYAIKGGGQGEFSSNAAEQRQYLVIFDRDGTYRKTIDVEDLPLRIENLGVFPSGALLAFGYDSKDESPKLALLKEDGSLLRLLEIKKGDVPESMIGKVGARRGVTAPAQFVPDDRSIIIVQNDSTFPLLEVSEGGAIEAIHPKLPRNSSIKAMIPSDRNLYAMVTQPGADSASKETIYELRREDGDVLRRFELADGRRPSQIACIHDQKFLSLDHGDGKIIPLIGSAEPANTADQQKGGAKDR